MFRNKLKALRYPFIDTLNVENDECFASIIAYLEDQKIRHYTIEDRKPLGTIEDQSAWPKAYDQYKADIGCPNFPTRLEELEWILAYAIRLEYMDNLPEYQQITAAKVSDSQKVSNPTTASINPFDAMDMQSTEFEQGVTELGRLLNIPSHHDHLKVLEAAAKIIDRHVNEPVNQDNAKQKTVAYSFDDTDQYAFKDKNLDKAAKILRLLQIHHTRNLQTYINETIVSAQKLTADPKTDTKLGKVGF